MNRVVDIVLAEDERILRNQYARLLTDAGYRVRVASNGEQALELIDGQLPDLVVLDVMMPKLGGYETCRRIREFNAELPVLFLTALDGDKDEIEGLNEGGDAWICKSVSDEVLLARIAAILRRVGGDDKGVFEFGGWRVESLKLRMIKKNKVEILTDREVAILRWFVNHPDEVLDRYSFIRRFWGGESEVVDAAVSMCLSRLRNKLGHDGDGIKSIRNSGYSYHP